MRAKGLPVKLSILLALLLALAPLAALPVTARDGEDDSGEDEDDRGQGRGRGRGQGEDHGIQVGRFEPPRGAGQARGAYVTFTPMPSGIANFSVEGVPLFTARSVAVATVGAPETEAKGSNVRVRGAGWDFRAHDIPTAEARFTSNEGFFLELPANVSAVERERGVDLFVGDLSATVFGKDLRLEGDRLYGAGTLNFLLRREGVGHDAARPALDAAKIAGLVGAEVLVKKLGSDVLEDAISYGNVTVDTLPQEDAVTFVVSGNESDPRVIILNVDAALLANATRDRLAFTYDNQTFHAADSLADILDPDNDDGLPEYYIVTDMDGTLQVIVSIPHYSVHTVTIQSLAALVPPQVSVTLGVVAATGFLALAAVTLFRRPKA